MESKYDSISVREKLIDYLNYLIDWEISGNQNSSEMAATITELSKLILAK
ncbi:hypothetical protein ACQW5G_01330 [Fructilactobacillus sp. Tb1]